MTRYFILGGLIVGAIAEGAFYFVVFSRVLQ